MSNANKINEFKARIAQRKKELDSGTNVPAQLQGLISHHDLKGIFDSLNKNLDKLVPRLKEGIPCRLDKKDTKLGRTFNLIFDQKTGDIELILETKSKFVSQSGTTEKKDIKVFFGGVKSVKPAWRIDEEVPTKVANAVVYESNIDGGEIKEAQIENKIAKKAGALDKENLINVSSQGPIIKKSGMRMHGPYHMQFYDKKQSHYSEYALGDLSRVLRKLTQKDKRAITLSLLKAVKLMHDKGQIHQDIKLENVLIFKDKDGNYSATLTDFGFSYDPKYSDKKHIAIAAVGYQSPELHGNRMGTHHENYFRSGFAYGAKVYEDNKDRYRDAGFSKPDKANDMWALGILLHKLFLGKFPHKSSDFANRPLIKGLLADKRKQRLTIDEALAIFQTKQQAKADPSKQARQEPNIDTKKQKKKDQAKVVPVAGQRPNIDAQKQKKKDQTRVVPLLANQAKAKGKQGKAPQKPFRVADRQKGRIPRKPN